MESNATSTLLQMLKKMNVVVRKENATTSLESHPNFPSLYSISDVLNSWKVENAAFKLDSLEKLHDLPLPFIIHTNFLGGWYKLVTQIKGDQVMIWDSIAGMQTRNINNVDDDFSSVVLIAEAKSDSGEVIKKTSKIQKLYTDNRIYLISALATLLIAILSINYLNFSGNLRDLLFATKILGIFTSILLLIKQIGSQNEFLEKVCRIKSSTNCDNLLNRPEAKLFGILSWSEIGFIYFTSTFLTLIIDGDNSSVIWLAILASLYTIYSIYFQAIVAKIWCPLCLFIQFLLLSELGISIAIDKNTPQLENFLSLTLSFSVTTILIFSIKPLIDKAQLFDESRKKLMSFSRNPSVFKLLLNEQQELMEVPTELSSLIIGDPNAEHTITMITNPYCRQCKERHDEISDLLQTAKNIKVRVILLTSGAEIDKVNTLAQHLIALDPEIFPIAIHDWFDQKKSNYENWAKRYPTKVNIESCKSIATQHGLWCWSQGLTATPIVFLNDRRLPDVYNMDELPWLISMAYSSNNEYA